MTDTKAKPKAKDLLTARVGLEFLGADGKVHRLEKGDQVDAEDVNPTARKWMGQAGFLGPTLEPAQEVEA